MKPGRQNSLMKGDIPATCTTSYGQLWSDFPALKQIFILLTVHHAQPSGMEHSSLSLFHIMPWGHICWRHTWSSWGQENWWYPCSLSTIDRQREPAAARRAIEETKSSMIGHLIHLLTSFGDCRDAAPASGSSKSSLSCKFFCEIFEKSGKMLKNICNCVR